MSSTNNQNSGTTTSFVSGDEELIYESNNSRIFRVTLKNGAHSVIRKEPVNADARLRLTHEAAILERLANVKGVAKMLSLSSDGGSMWTDDRGGVSLAQYMESDQFDESKIIQIALTLAGIISEIHSHGVIHNDINPSNILLYGEEREPVIIDFNLASEAGEDSAESSQEQGELAGTLAYIAPERTGRTNRRADQRADLYSFGATLYELATGKLPFEKDDPLELIQDHLTRVPKAPIKVHEGVSLSLSNIIMHLLEKEPDRRYHSARGLVYDLQLARDAAVNGVQDFKLGQRDFPARFNAPDHLIGRESESKFLRDALTAAMNDASSGIFVSGEAGIGKSVLVEELRSSVISRNGRFLVSKSEVSAHHNGVPVILHAFRSLAQQLLAESDAEISSYRERLTSQLKENVDDLVAAIPDFGLLLDQSRVTQGEDDTNAESRLVEVGIKVLRSLASPTRPIVLVLDDLQWASQDTIDFIETWLFEGGVRGVLLVAIYRDESAERSDALGFALERWQKIEIVPSILSLSPLSTESTSVFLGEMLRLSQIEAQRLAKAFVSVTNGNPYNTIELINALRKEGVLRPQSDSWVWDEEAIASYADRADVADLLNARIERLPEDTIEVLKMLACLGGNAQLGLLIFGSGMQLPDVITRLMPSIKDDLTMIVQSDEGSVHFSDNRILNAAYDLLDSHQRKEIHLNLARRLQRLPILVNLAAEQYLLAIEAGIENCEPFDEIIGDIEETRKVAQLFHGVISTGRDVDPRVAERYLNTAIELLFNSDASVDIDTMRFLEIERHAVLYRVGNLDEADASYKTICETTFDPLELTSSTCVQIRSLTNRGQLDAALTLGHRLLQDLGVVLPNQEAIAKLLSKPEIDNEIWRHQLLEDGDLEAELSNDNAAHSVAKLIRTLHTTAALCDVPLAVWLLSEAARRWGSDGPVSDHVATLTNAIRITALQQDDYCYGRDIADRMLTIAMDRHYESEIPYIRHVRAYSVQHWFEDIELGTEQAQRAIRGALRIGDTQTASIAQLSLLSIALDSTPTIQQFANTVDTAVALAERCHNDHAKQTLATYGEFVQILTSRSTPEVIVDSPPNVIADALTLTHRALAAAIFGDKEELAALISDIKALLPLFSTAYVATTLHLLVGLAAAESHNKYELDETRSWFAARAQDAPDNFSHLAQWFLAEQAWANDDFQTATVAFDQALQEVSQRNRPWHRALIAERAGLFQLDCGLIHIGRTSLSESHNAYYEWGALAKVEQMEKQYPFTKTMSMAHFNSKTSGSLRSGTVMGFSSDSVDMLAVLKASRALSSETNLDSLRTLVKSTLSTMTGATSVWLALYNEEAQNWFLPAGAVKGEGNLTIDEAAERGLLPLSVFRYAERTGRPLVVEDLLRDNRFVNDPYLENLERCSLLVVPVISQSVTRAMLVLENRLSANVFTTDRLDSVLLVAQQLAVTLDNVLAERFRSLVQRSSELTLVCGRDAVISYANVASKSMLGLGESELIGKKVMDVVHEEDRSQIAENIEKAALHPVDTLESRIIHADGSERWVEVTFTDLLSDPAVGGVVLNMRDITERRRLENELRYAQKLESVGVLASGLAHEINTPIQFIGNNLEFLSGAFDTFAEAVDTLGSNESNAQNDEIEFLKEEVPIAVAQTREGVERVATIVKAMRAFGLASNEKTYIDINEAINTTLVVVNNEVSPVAEVLLELGEIPQAFCIASDINQVLLNIFVNAAWAIRENGGVGTIRISTRFEQNDVVIDIQDTGIGIAPEIADRVFEQFFTTKEVGSGTGQGLAIVYSLIHNHHDGTVGFVSEPGQGTTFTIRLPQPSTDDSQA